MPILIKKLDGSIISYIAGGTADVTGGVRLIRAVVGETGLEDYIKLTALEALVQDFSQVIDGDFYNKPAVWGSSTCAAHTTLNLSYGE